MSGPKKTIDARANREIPKSDGLAHAVMQLIESPHIVNMSTEIEKLKAENVSFQTDHDKLRAETIVQRERILAGHAEFIGVMGQKDAIIRHLETQYLALAALHKKHILGMKGQLEQQVAQYDEHMTSMEERLDSKSAFIKSLLAEKASALEKAKSEESDTYVSKCLECGEVLSSDTRQLCGKYVCHNA